MHPRCGAQAPGPRRRPRPTPDPRPICLLLPPAKRPACSGPRSSWSLCPSTSCGRACAGPSTRRACSMAWACSCLRKCWTRSAPRSWPGPAAWGWPRSCTSSCLSTSPRRPAATPRRQPSILPTNKPARRPTSRARRRTSRSSRPPTNPPRSAAGQCQPVWKILRHILTVERMTALASLVRRTAILVLLLLFAAGVQAAARVYPLEAVQPGLRGTAKTVVRGTEIETFEVEFLGVMRDAGPAGDLILIRASGDVIDRTGGIAAGMSGSPVYIGEQLVGAIAYAYSLSDHRIGFVTPIRDMLEVLRMLEPDREAAPAVPADEPGATDGGPAAGPLAGTGEVSVREVILAESWQEAGELAREAPPGTMVFAPVRAPLLASGFSSRAFARLGEDLRAFNLVPVQAGGQAPPEAAAAPALEPGSAFGVQLVRGDVSLTSIGTVTYVEDDRFVGFGHSFLDRGPVDYVTTSAYIHYVVPSIDFPFKIGSVLEPVGALAQDRGAGVAGRNGQTPRMIPVTVSVQDLDRGVTRTTNFEVAADESFIVSLATSGAR